MLAEWIQQASQQARPIQASLELTNRCNERCTHCYLPAFRDDPEQVLNLDQWQKVLSELRSGGVLYLVLMGGEPLLNRHYFRIVETAVAMGFHVSTITNGTLITKGVASRLHKVGLHHLTFSYYSLDPAIHDAMTQMPGSHAKTTAAISYCLELGIDIGCNCLLTRQNIDRFYELADWALARGIEVRPDPHVTAKLDGDRSPLKLRATSEQLQRFYQEQAQRWPDIDLTPPTSLDEQVCNAAQGKCAVNAYGDLLPCVEARLPLGNLVAQDFATAWNHPRAHPWRSLKRRDLSGSCDTSCDHCPAAALHDHGDLKRIGTFEKRLAQIKREAYNHLSTREKS